MLAISASTLSLSSLASATFCYIFWKRERKELGQVKGGKRAVRHIALIEKTVEELVASDNIV